MFTIKAKSIVTKSSTPWWFGCDYNMNIYRGCSHGCIYCDSRSECYRVNDFDVVRSKENALLMIDKELKSKKMKGVVATGSMSDPYNPHEEEESLTREALALLNRHHFGVGIATKSSLIVRDRDLLKAISIHSPVISKITITTADDDLCKLIEPNVSSSSERFKALYEISNDNIFAGVLLMPLLPFINDTIDNVVEIVDSSHKNGAKFVFASFGMTLRDNQRKYFYEMLDRKFPGISQKYVNLFGNKYSCMSPNMRALSNAFVKRCEKHGILYKMEDIIAAYKEKYLKHSQRSLFD